MEPGSPGHAGIVSAARLKCGHDRRTCQETTGTYFGRSVQNSLAQAINTEPEKGAARLKILPADTAMHSPRRSGGQPSVTDGTAMYGVEGQTSGAMDVPLKKRKQYGFDHNCTKGLRQRQ